VRPRVVDEAFSWRLEMLEGTGDRHRFGRDARPGLQPVSERLQRLTTHTHMMDQRRTGPWQRSPTATRDATRCFATTMPSVPIAAS
jgi:hypothetical protein